MPSDDPRPDFAALARECVYEWRHASELRRHLDAPGAWNPISLMNLEALELSIQNLLARVVQEREAQLVKEFADACTEFLTPAAASALLTAIRMRQRGTP